MKLDFDKFFEDDKKIETEYGMQILKIHEIGDLVIPTGFVIACDPFINYNSQPFTMQIPTGTFPVVLSVADFGDDQRVAYAKLQISNKSAVRWELALLPNQDVNSLIRR